MEKKKHFHSTKFSQEAIQQAWDKLESFLSSDDRKKISSDFDVKIGKMKHGVMTREAEFFAMIRKTQSMHIIGKVQSMENSKLP